MFENEYKFLFVLDEEKERLYVEISPAIINLNVDFGLNKLKLAPKSIHIILHIIIMYIMYIMFYYYKLVWLINSGKLSNHSKACQIGLKMRSLKGYIQIWMWVIIKLSFLLNKRKSNKYSYTIYLI